MTDINNIGELVNAVKIEDLIALGVASLGMYGVVKWGVGYKSAMQEREAAKERLYQRFDAIPKEQQPAVAELLHEIRGQDPRSTAAYRIGHVLDRYNR